MEVLSIHQTALLLLFLIINPLLAPSQTPSTHPAVIELPPASTISATAEKLPEIYASGGEMWPEACFVCVCACVHIEPLNTRYLSTVLTQNIQSLTLNSGKVKIIYGIFIMKP